MSHRFSRRVQPTEKNQVIVLSTPLCVFYEFVVIQREAYCTLTL